MKHPLIITLCLLLTLSGCNYSQFSAVATGSGMGGMLGSSIGGIAPAALRHHRRPARL